MTSVAERSSNYVQVGAEQPSFEQLCQNSLSAYFKTAVEPDYEVVRRDDYTGMASCKRRIGSTTVVRCTFVAEGNDGLAVTTRCVEVTEKLFDDATCRALRAVADQRYKDDPASRIIRDIVGAE